MEIDYQPQKQGADLGGLKPCQREPAKDIDRELAGKLSRDQKGNPMRPELIIPLLITAMNLADDIVKLLKVHWLF